jgi:hypothetical protein
MPVGTMPVATVAVSPATSETSRRQSTARAIAWRTRTSSNGGLVVSKP